MLAIIVTYKRPEILLRCLNSLALQINYGLKKIHVVINSEESNTLEVVNRFRGTVNIPVSHDIFNNEGPAGGFYFGLKTFLSQPEFQFAWLMDDDIVVADDCLEKLLSHTADNLFVYPKVISSTGKELVSYGWWGVLLHRELILKVGLPLKEFFYWAEDTEYLMYRIHYQNGYTPFRSETAVVEHLHLRGIKRPSWYYYYAPRNTLFLRLYIAKFTWFRFIRTLVLLPHLIYTIVVREDKKISKLALLFYGTLHGLIKKTGKCIDPDIWK